MAKTILIVEDNQANMMFLNDLLEAKGYQTLQSANGDDALELTRRHSPDLILMDIQLPGLSGLDVTKILKADDAFKHIPIIAVTAFAMKGDEERIRKAGCDDFVSKPVSMSALLDAIASFIG
jgi:two-component system cell cycle response regulator DivK